MPCLHKATDSARIAAVHSSKRIERQELLAARLASEATSAAPGQQGALAGGQRP